jgi:hypothetical protein
MVESKELREYKKLLNKYLYKPRYSGYLRHTDINYIKLRKIELTGLVNHKGAEEELIIINKVFEIYNIGIKLGLTYDSIRDMFINLESNKYKRGLVYSQSPEKETRDNKGTYVGSGGENCHKVRYPKKNRSKRVWAMFYKMFPYYARLDNWNGETSKRMK